MQGTSLAQSAAVLFPGNQPLSEPLPRDERLGGVNPTPDTVIMWAALCHPHLPILPSSQCPEHLLSLSEACPGVWAPCPRRGKTSPQPCLEGTATSLPLPSLL